MRFTPNTITPWLRFVQKMLRMVHSKTSAKKTTILGTHRMILVQIETKNANICTAKMERTEFLQDEPPRSNNRSTWNLVKKHARSTNPVREKAILTWIKQIVGFLLGRC